MFVNDANVNFKKEHNKCHSTIGSTNGTIITMVTGVF